MKLSQENRNKNMDYIQTPHHCSYLFQSAQKYQNREHSQFSFHLPQAVPSRDSVNYMSIVRDCFYGIVVRERTIPTERLPLIGEVSVNFCG
jgi:hypothetical protein